MKKLFNSIVNYFDKAEDKVRMRISRYPIFFALVGGFAIVEFWRGVWQITDYFLLESFNLPIEGFWSNIISIIIGTGLLLITGLYVSLFISDSVIISGIKKDRKDFEKAIEKMQKEENQIVTHVSEIKTTNEKVCNVESEVFILRKEIAEIKELLKNK
jgi:hypothetical protein